MVSIAVMTARCVSGSLYIYFAKYRLCVELAHAFEMRFYADIYVFRYTYIDYDFEFCENALREFSRWYIFQ